MNIQDKLKTSSLQLVNYEMTSAIVERIHTETSAIITVSGANFGIVKTDDIPTGLSELTNDAGYVTVSGLSTDSDPAFSVLSSRFALKEEIPTGLSELTNDANYLTDYTETDPIFQELTGKLALKSEMFDGNYSSLTGTPEIPYLLSQLTNDMGFISVQSDPLYTADKPNIALKSELFSKAYNDLTGKPTKLSQFENDSGFITGFTEVEPAFAAASGNFAVKSELFSKSYNDLTDKPSIPTKVSDLTNDSNFITSATTVTAANQLATARTITLSGAIIGSQTFDGSDNIVLNTVLADGITIDASQLSSITVNYEDILNKPTIPTKVSDLTNDAGYLSAHQSLADYAKTSDVNTLISNVSSQLSGAFRFQGSKDSYDLLTATVTPAAGDVYQVGDKEYAYSEKTHEWVELGFNIDLSNFAKSFNDLSDKPTTLSGYGITDALAKTDISAWAKASDKPTYTFSEITNKPTTLSGYGITDAFLKSTDLADWAKASDKPTYTFSEINSKPSTLSGYGITDALKADSIKAWAKADTKPTYTFAELSSKPTTIADYGITDVKIEGNKITVGSNAIIPLTGFTETDPTIHAWAKAENKPTYKFSEITSTPSTLQGYGITDAYISGQTIKIGNLSLNVLTSFEEEDPIYTADKPNLALKSELFSKNYSDLSGVPTKLSQFINDSNFISGYTETEPAFAATSGSFAVKSELFSKSYNDLTDKPSIPTKTSDLTNDSGFMIEYTETDPVFAAASGSFALKTELFSKSYNDLTDKPTIPTNVSDLTNDNNFITSAATVNAANKLATARTITLSGAIVGSQTFDGSGNITVNTALADGITIDASQISGMTISYEDIINKPSIPTKTSDLTNDSGFLTTEPAFAAASGNFAVKSELFSKNYSDLNGTPTKLSDFTNDEGFIKTEAAFAAASGSFAVKSELFSKSYNDLTDKPTIPSKTSELTNDSGFLTGYVETEPAFSNASGNFAVKSELFSKSYNDLTDKPTIPSKTSDLTNDSGFLTSEPAFSNASGNFALKSELFSKSYNDLTDTPTIPTKVSELTNDSNFLTGYVETEPAFANTSGNFALKSELFSKKYTDLTDTPTKLSEFTNDAGYLSAHQSLADYAKTSDVNTLISNVSSHLSGAFRFQGNAASYAELTAIVNPVAGDVYQIGDKEYAYSDKSKSWVELGFNIDLSDYAKTFDDLSDKPTTLSGYGITDALAKTDISAWAKASDKPTYTFSEVSGNAPTTLAGYGITDGLKTSDISDWAKAATKPTYRFSEVSGNAPTTLSGYGITDGLTTSDISDWAKASTKPSYNFSEVSGGAPTTLAGYGITDVKINGNNIQLGTTSENFLKTSDISDWAKAANKPTYTFNEVSGSAPTTLSGYGITDGLKTDDIKAWAKADTKPTYLFSELSSKPTTITEYGITDVKITGNNIQLGTTSGDFLKTSDISDWAKASTKPTYTFSEVSGNAPTTLAGYGITDGLKDTDISDWAKASTKPTYTFSEVSGNTPTTLVGYGITDGLKTTDISDWAKASTKPSYIFSEVSGSAPTTLAGYGITDGLKTSDISTWAKAANKPAYTFSEVSGGAPTTLAGYGISDVKINGNNIQLGTTTGDFLKTSDISTWAKASTKPTYTFSEVSGNAPTTLAGYGITDGLKTDDIKAWAKADTKPTYLFSELSSKPNTLSEYGITDVKITGNNIQLGATAGDFLKTTDISDWAKASTKPTYTFNEVSGNAPTTLAGYGISDVKITGNNIQLGTTTGDFLKTSDISAWAKAANKPTYTFNEVSGSAPTTLAGYGITDGLKTSDISNWAKSSTKPSYNFSEVSAGAPTTLAGYGITDGLKTTDISDWAKASTKPSYTFSEVSGNAPTTLSGYGITDASQKSIITSATVSNGLYTANYNNGDIHNITLAASATFMVTNLPLGEALVIRCQNPSGYIAQFAGQDVISVSGSYYLSFSNIIGTPELIGSAVDITLGTNS